MPFRMDHMAPTAERLAPLTERCLLLDVYCRRIQEIKIELYGTTVQEHAPRPL